MWAAAAANAPNGALSCVHHAIFISKFGRAVASTALAEQKNARKGPKAIFLVHRAFFVDDVVPFLLKTFC